MRVGKNLLMGMLCLAHSMNHSLLLVLSPLLLVVSSDLNVSAGTLSQIAAIGMFMYGGGAVLGGAISDKLGEEKAITIAMGLSGLSTLLVFLLPGIYGIGVGLFFIATWSSVYHPTANSFINKVYKDNMAMAMSWHGIGGTYNHNHSWIDLWLEISIPTLRRFRHDSRRLLSQIQSEYQ